MDGLLAQTGNFFAAQPIGWGALVLAALGYFFMTRILKLIFFCVFLVAIAAGYFYLTHPSGSKPADDGVKTVIEKKH
ncbi:hypothetical protein HZU75_11425 [Chitinibacter fontanus]|uniref:Uncharacterized protein n=1 Tax=Chitinibacter fontanus TaxID=1737446 RepID=A0A7D5ZEK1_9NEIS|nr:hypothetical protein [Chitinibacter fontanus]QLI82086.1 hypothetical protein HZU75_11425 [Chitinibacter fontanus]